MAQEQKPERRYLGGSTRIDLSVARALGALALLAADADQYEMVEYWTSVMEAWMLAFPALSDQALEIWADHYHTLVAVESETAAEMGVEDEL